MHKLSCRSKNYQERLRLFSDGSLFSAQLIFTVDLSLSQKWPLKQGFVLLNMRFLIETLYM